MADNVTLPKAAAIKFKRESIPLEVMRYNKDNYRSRGGSTVDGIKLVDTYNIPMIKDKIRETGGLPGERPRVERFEAGAGPWAADFPKDGKHKWYVVCLTANRRTIGAQELMADQSTEQSLVKALEKIECDVYTGLDAEQRAVLINDQQSEPYKRGDLVMAIWRAQANGWSNKQIAMHFYTQLYQYTGQGAQKQVEINACKTQTEREEKVMAWLKGTLILQILAAGRFGPRVRRAFLLSDLLKDGLAPVLRTDADGRNEYEQPEFRLSQGRCNALNNAKKEDGADWTPENGGPKFNALIESFIAEDKRGAAGLDEHGNKIPVRQTMDQLTKQKDVAKSKAAQAALDIAMGKSNDAFADFDANAKRLEELEQVAVKHRNDLKPGPVFDLVKIFLTGDKLELESFLMKHAK